MRIRTIKPEFWGHPVMSRLPDAARMAAVGLLNVADDKGYFYADPALIRSALWPLDEDSSKARRTLEHLIDAGWIQVKNHPSHGLIGWVVNFTVHQRVDRANGSKIACYFLDDHSTIIRRFIDDSSSTDQGSGIRDQGMESSSPPYNEDPKEEQPETPNGDVTDALKAVEAVWSVWPKKVKTLEAKMAIRTAIARDGLDVVLAGTRAIVAAHGQQGPTPGRFLPDPVLFFGNSRYLDDPAQYAPREATANHSPVWQQIQALQQAYDTHPGNPKSVAYNRARTTEAQMDEAKALNDQLSALKSQAQAKPQG